MNLPGGRSAARSCTSRMSPRLVGFLSWPSSWYLNRTACCALLGAEKFSAVKWISNCSFPGRSVTASGQTGLSGLFFCGTPSTSTDSMTTGGGLFSGFKSAGLTDARPSIVGNQNRPSRVRMAAGCAPAEHSRVRNVRQEIFLPGSAAKSASDFFSTRVKPSYEPIQRLVRSSSMR